MNHWKDKLNLNANASYGVGIKEWTAAKQLGDSCSTVHTYFEYDGLGIYTDYNKIEELLLTDQEGFPKFSPWVKAVPNDRVSQITQLFVDDFGTQCLEIVVSLKENKIVQVQYATTNKYYLPEFVKALSPYKNTAKVVEDNYMHALSKTMDGYEFSPIGKFNTELVFSNYAQTVQTRIPAVLETLQSHNPSGRLIILMGEPGTGKTNFIKGLASNTTSCQYIFIHPSFLSSLSDPSILPSLMHFRKEEKSLVFVVEDADTAVTSRSLDNMTTMSALLNWGDGILGSMLNTKFILTTNARKVDLDPAIMRPGRLAHHLTLDRLNTAEANVVLERLRPGTTELFGAEGATLAEVYRKVRDLNNGKEVNEETSEGDGDVLPEARQATRSIGFR